MDVNEELKFLGKFTKKSGGGVGKGGQVSRGLINSKFGVIYSNFLNLTPTF